MESIRIRFHYFFSIKIIIQKLYFIENFQLAKSVIKKVYIRLLISLFN